MKHYGFKNPEGSHLENITVPSGTGFPADENVGELFYRTDQNALYVYTGSAWDDLGTASTLWVESGSDIYYDTGNVGIGETSPGYALHVNSGTVDNVAMFQSTDANALVLFSDNTTSSNQPYIGATGNLLKLRSGHAGGEDLVIDTSGRVGLGTSSLTGAIHILDPADTGRYFRMQRTTPAQTWELQLDGNGDFVIGDITSGTTPLTVDTDGHVGIGQASAGIGNLHI